MTKEIFEPNFNPEQKYAVAVYIGNKRVCPIESYPTEESLENGYRVWSEMAKKRNLSKPVPIEFTSANGKCEVREDIMKKLENMLI
ncbi:hypothetical protein HYT25_00870 [Candidatus Pacearchaeota archaeon]|nr:hypothetical protein [Candidatus Pacearchaeota archaeon]